VNKLWEIEKLLDDFAASIVQVIPFAN